ncbi:MAG TPA: CoA-binding protein [Candidatus Sulfotelmatobacter sp.]|nr:CoA-binding protein [Candidatus Sulfotelmatobacter sp.]
MAHQPLSLETIEDFVAQKRIAMIGASRDPKSFSIMLFKEFTRRGYDIVPVNPKTPNVQGQTCYARVQDIQPPVEAALLITAPAATERAVADCANAGIRRIWIFAANGKSPLSQKTLDSYQEQGIKIIAGQCPYMFLPGSGGVHRFHGFVRKITGRYPQRSAA